MKFASTLLMLLGCLFLAVGLYQANQYWVSSSTIAPSLLQLNEASKDPATMQSLGMNANDLESTKSTILAGTNAMLQAMAFDLVLGIVLLLLAWKTQPQETNYQNGLTGKVM